MLASLKKFVQTDKILSAFSKKNPSPTIWKSNIHGKRGGGGGGGGRGADKKWNIPLDIKSVGMSNLILKVFLKVCFSLTVIIMATDSLIMQRRLD